MSQEILKAALGMDSKLMALGFSNGVLLKLGENKVLTLDDFADLSRAEFVEFVPDSRLSPEEIDSMIMKARAHWFDDEPAAGDAADDAPGDAPAEGEPGHA